MYSSAIQAKDLIFSYNGKPAVNKLSLEIKPGEAFGLLGPNGAGKSTTINLLVGLLRPDEGTVKVFDGDPTGQKIRRQIGISPQSLSLYGELTAEENLSFFGKMYGLSGPELQNRVNESLQLSGLEDRKSDRVKTYSGGMKRRLNIATALIHYPQLLLLDEPTVGVDPQSRNHIFESIERLKEAGLTILYTTHYMEEAQRLCDTVAIMDHGEILAVDQTDQLIEKFGGDSWIELEIANEKDKSMIEDLRKEGDWKHFQMEGDHVKFQTPETQQQLTKLVNSRIVFNSLQVRRPDLENVFLNLTGRSLRDG